MKMENGKMILKKSFKLNIDTHGSGRNLVFICHDNNSLTYLLGTKAVSGNQHCYDIKKEANNWVVPVNTVIERINTLTRRVESIQQSIDIMIQLIAGGQNDSKKNI